jgi:hypothetical protein
VSSYQRPNSKNFKLLRPFSSEPSEPTTFHPAHASYSSSRSTLAKLLFLLLSEALLNSLHPRASLNGNHHKQDAAIRRAAKELELTLGDQRLQDCLALSLKEYGELERYLIRNEPGWERPQGIFIEVFKGIESNTLIPYSDDNERLKITGKLTVFGEGKKLNRPPYLVIGLMGQPREGAKTIELLEAYAHPCVDWRRLMLLDSNLERDTLDLLVRFRDQIAKKKEIDITIKKPLFNMASPNGKDHSEVCIPDFIIHASGPNVKNPAVIIEAMGYDDLEYRERKTRMHALFSQIGQGPHPIPIIEHDRFNPGTTQDQADKIFVHQVRDTIMGTNK